MPRAFSTTSRQSVASASGHAAIYTRISNDKEGLALGVARQREDTLTKAEALGLTVVAEFEDNDISASTRSRKRRPQYEDMIERARAGEFGTVIAYSNSRLTRRPLELEDWIALYETHGVTVRTVVSGDDDLGTADGRMTARIKAAVDAAEAERVAERVGRAARQRVEDGRWHGGVPPFGYRRENKALYIDETEAALVREAASRVLDQDETLYGVVKDWNSRGVVTRRGTAWRHSVLRNVLINPALIGTNSAGVEDCWESVIEKKAHLQLAAKLAPDTSRRTNTEGVKSSKYPLGGGLVRCGRCGGPLATVARKTQGTVKMACRSFMNGDHPNHAPDENGDKGRVSIDAVLLEKYLYERCGMHLDDVPHWDRVKRERDEADSDLARLRDEHEVRLAERSRAARSFIAGILTESEAQAEVARLDTELEDIAARIDKTQGGPLGIDVWGERRDVLARWDDWSAGEKRLFFRSLIKSVKVGDWPEGVPTTTLPRKSESLDDFEARRDDVAREAMLKRIEIVWH